ncbi:phosphatase PAP2 family protein [Lichenihabitans sp. PAMC28606]|uniref:phosphatase PAP2 family protein n=1 Tax=Lichenihabitans sp. PAMC28606 TaxID=2880932 RepID=UPI001D0A1B62|nr:phosphatase PAP2 family protein [Lichenihabitans sp. PAMC28606]UDL95096.1 phosphatase PAP2 family protein [Lichenihabitans sp. PAMC28606]
MMQQIRPDRAVIAGVTKTDAAAPSLVAIRFAAVVMLALATVLLSSVVDVRVATVMADLPSGDIRAASYLSDLGLSGYMFALAALVAIGPLLVRHFSADQRWDEALTVLAERGAYVFATLAVSGILAQVIKHLVGRARPTLMEAFGAYHFDILSMKASLASFPSGHAATVFSVAIALGALAPRWRIALLLLATLVAVSRVAVEAHYVSDVVAGAALGIVSATVVTRLFAGWHLAFDRVGSTIRLKQPGLFSGAFAASGFAP